MQGDMPAFQAIQVAVLAMFRIGVVDWPSVASTACKRSLARVDLAELEGRSNSHTGRWEPLPGIGDLAEVTALVVDLLAPYLDPNSWIC